MNNIRRFLEVQEELTYFQQEHIAQERASFRKRSKIKPPTRDEINAATQVYFSGGGQITRLPPEKDYSIL